MAKISLIIPTYNSCNDLKKIIENVEQQTYKDYELIIVNDGSNDETEKMVLEYKKIFKNIIYIYQKNMGPGLARRNGFLNSNGELLFFIDCDDYLPNNDILEKINRIYNESRFEILFFDYKVDYGKKIETENALKTEKIENNKIQKIEKIKKYVEGALWSKIFIRSKMKENYFYDANNYEDYYTTYMYLNNCNNFLYVHEIFYEYKKNNEHSISKIKSISKYNMSLKIACEIYDKSKLKESANDLLINCYIMVGRGIIKNKKIKSLIDLDKIVNIKNLNFKYISLKSKIKLLQIELYKKIRSN